MKNPWAVVAVVAGFGLLGLVAWLGLRSSAGARKYLEGQGFTRLATCPVALPLKEHVSELDCLEGELRPGLKGMFFLGTSHQPVTGWSVPEHFIGIYFPPEAPLTDAWLAAWQAKLAKPDTVGADQPVLARRDDRRAILMVWNNLDDREHTEKILAMVRQSLP